MASRQRGIEMNNLLSFKWKFSMVKWQLKNKRISKKQKAKNILYLIGLK